MQITRLTQACKISHQLPWGMQIFTGHCPFNSVSAVCYRLFSSSCGRTHSIQHPPCLQNKARQGQTTFYEALPHRCLGFSLPPLSLSHSKTFMQNYSQVDTFSSWMLNFQLLLFKVKRKHFPAIHPLSLCHALKPDKVVILEINKQKAHMETSGWSSQCDSWRRSCLTLRLVHI